MQSEGYLLYLGAVLETMCWNDRMLFIQTARKKYIFVVHVCINTIMYLLDNGRDQNEFVIGPRKEEEIAQKVNQKEADG